MEGLNPQQENEIIGTKATKEAIKEVLSDEPGTEKMLIIRHDTAKQELKLRERELFSASGNIDTVSRYLAKRAHLINEEETTILIDRDKMSISIHSNETNFFGDKLDGKLAVHPDFLKFGINANKTRTTQEMADFFRMHRAFFPDLAQNMNLVTVLKKFEASVDLKIKEIKEANGGAHVSRETVVTSTVPASFLLFIPLFKGLEHKTIEVETIITVSNNGAIVVALESPEAQEIMEKYKNEVIDNEIDKISASAPAVLIIEK